MKKDAWQTLAERVSFYAAPAHPPYANGRQGIEMGIDHDKEVSEARQEAWDEYKAIHFRDLG